MVLLCLTKLLREVCLVVCAAPLTTNPTNQKYVLTIYIFHTIQLLYELLQQ